MLKEKLTKEANNYEIKLTSNDILDNYHKKEETNKSKKFNFATLIPVFAGCFICIISATLIAQNTEENNNLFADTISLEVSSSLSLLKAYNTTSINGLRKSNINEDEFIEICNDFMDNYSVVDKSLSYKNNDKNKIEEGTFDVDNKTYTYKISLSNDNYLYYSAKTQDDNKEYKEKYEGVLVFEDEIYEVDGKRSLNSISKEDEIDLTIKIDDVTTLQIQQESERSEFSYSYEIIKNNVSIYELEIDFENDEIEMESYKDNVEYEYQINYKNNKYIVSYERQENDNEIEGVFYLSIEDNQYIFEDKENSLIYKIYQ